MTIDAYLLQVEEAHFVEPVEIMMVETTKGLDREVKEVIVLDYTEKMKVVYPKAEGKLIDFLSRCKLKGSEVILFPRCSIVFDKKATKGLESVRPCK